MDKVAWHTEAVNRAGGGGSGMDTPHFHHGLRGSRHGTIRHPEERCRDYRITAG